MPAVSNPTGLERAPGAAGRRRPVVTLR